MQQPRKNFNQFETVKYPSPATKNVWLPRFPISLQRENTGKNITSFKIIYNM